MDRIKPRKWVQSGCATTWSGTITTTSNAGYLITSIFMIVLLSIVSNLHVALLFAVKHAYNSARLITIWLHWIQYPTGSPFYSDRTDNNWIRMVVNFILQATSNYIPISLNWVSLFRKCSLYTRVSQWGALLQRTFFLTLYWMPNQLKSDSLLLLSLFAVTHST